MSHDHSHTPANYNEAFAIGGLISLTLLTLSILPTLYNVFERKASPTPDVHLPEPPSTMELYGNSEAVR